MKNSARPHALFVALAAVGLAFAATSCSSDDPETMPINPGDATDSISATAYVVAATVDGTSYLLTASSLSEGTLSVKGQGTEVTDATYWVFKGQKYLFGLVYNQGGNGTGASYYLDAAGTIREKYLYEYNRITTYGTWGQHVVTASTAAPPPHRPTLRVICPRCCCSTCSMPKTVRRPRPLSWPKTSWATARRSTWPAWPRPMVASMPPSSPAA